MTDLELLSKRTRNAFREFMVGSTLRNIEGEFEAAHVDCDRTFQPSTVGARRSLVEQYYHTLDFASPPDVRRLLCVFEGVLEKAKRELPTHPDSARAESAIKNLESCLQRDGLRYQNGRIAAAAPSARAIFEEEPPDHQVSEVTRRNIFDEIRVRDISWSGRLSEVAFLERLYDLNALPTTDGRFDSMRGDIWQHRENNLDWPADWVFGDSRLNLLRCGEKEFLGFLCEMVHPVVRPDAREASEIVELFNPLLRADGWQIAQKSLISNRAVYAPRRRGVTEVQLPAEAPLDVLSDEYVEELSRKCDNRLAAGDFEGAITTGRTVLEAILSELEVRLTGARGDHKGDLPRQFKQVAKVLRMDDERSDLDDRFKDVIRGLVTVVNGIAPLRNKLSDGHARVRKPAPHHARVVVNASKTVASFVVESYLYQKGKGSLSDAPAKGGKYGGP